MARSSRAWRITMITAATALTLAAATNASAAPDRPHPKLLWEVSYDGGSGHHDYARQVATTDHAIYVAASTQDSQAPADFTLLRYSLGGDLRWERHFGGTFSRTGEPSDLVVAGAGVIVTGLTRDDAGASVTTVRYGPHGHVRWSRTRALGGQLASADGPKLAVADDGSIRVSASSGGDFLVISYASDGAKQWARQVDASDGEGDVATDVAVDDDGNTYVAGPVGDLFGGYTTVKLDVGGHVDWMENVHGPFGSTLGPAFVEIGPDQLPVVSAVPESSCGLLQSRTWKFEPDGTVQWEVAYPEDPCDSITPVGMGVRPDGSVVVLGTGGTIEVDFVTLSYDATGQLEWTRLLGDGGVDVASALAIDDAGRAYVTGVNGLQWPDSDALTASYDRAGDLRWRTRPDVEGQIERPADIALLDDGTLAVTGDSFDPDRLEDVSTLRYRQP